jgi:uncharacterized repeat protein (TIGR01451 family)
LIEIIPANTIFDAANSDSRWICEGVGAGNICRLNLGNVVANIEGTVQFSIILSSTATSSQLIFNLAGISNDGTHGIDTNSDNNTSNITTLIIDSGSTGTITGQAYLNPNNNSVQDATEPDGNIPLGTIVKITDTSDPLKVFFVTINQDGSYSQVVPAGNYSVIIIPPSGYSISVSKEFGDGSGSNPTIVTAVALLTKSAGKDGLYKIPKSVNLELFKTIKEPAYKQGETLVYSFKFNNLGIDDASGVVLTEYMPASLGFISASYLDNPITPVIIGNSYMFNIGYLPVGDQREILITAKILTNGGTISNTA